MTAFAPQTESRIRELQSGRADRDAKRADAAATQAERERKSQEVLDADRAEKRASVSPNEITAQQRHIAACEFYADLHKQRQAQEQAERRNADIKVMADLKAEWDNDSTTPARRGVIVRNYADLYRKYAPNVDAAMVLKYWEQERKQAILQKLYAAAIGENK